MKKLDIFFKSKTGLILFGIFSMLLLNGLYAITRNRPSETIAATSLSSTSPTITPRVLTFDSAKENIKKSYWSNLSPYERLKVGEFRDSLPYASKNIEITFSPDVNQFLITLKSDTSDAQRELTSYLDRRNILDIYLENPALFSVGHNRAETTLAAAHRELEDRAQELAARENIKGLSVQAQQPQSPQRIDEVNLPDQGANRDYIQFLIDVVKGTPDDPELDPAALGPTTPGPATGTPIGPVTPQDPPGLATKITVNGYDYYQIPESPDETYSIYSCPARRYGSRELLQVLYAVGKRYREMTGGADSIWIGDLNASGHASHKWGIAVDIVTKGMGTMMNSAGYNPTFAKYLGEAFVSTGMIKNIWYCDQGVVNHVTAFARERNLPLQQMYCIDGHYDHFHVDINIEGGPEHTPSC